MLVEFLEQVVGDKKLHVKWLNTLSMMENVGARKIAAAEHPTKVTTMMLKHAAEEARHAYYLKRLISKLDISVPDTYDFQYLLAPINSLQYLHRLDVFASRYLKEELGLKGHELKYASYLLVTYAIEVRADELYPIYEDVLKRLNSKVSVRTIIVEEEGHLADMKIQLEDFSTYWEAHANAITSYESLLFDKWLEKTQASISPKVLFAH